MTELLVNLEVEATPRGIRRIRLDAEAPPNASDPPPTDATTAPEALLLAERAHAQLREYLAGTRTHFDLPLDLAAATPFRRRVLDALLGIPFGTVVSYGAIARQIGCGSARAVGQAVGWNPLPIVIPCHRVVAEGGRLGGFSSGLDRKRALLAIEGIPIS